MRTIRKMTERASLAVRRLGGLLVLVPALLLCAWLLTLPAHAADSTYLFEVCTGAATGDESKIDFFIITYTTANNADGVSKLLFPRKDAWTLTYDMAYQVSQEQEMRDNDVRKAYGYSGADLRNNKPIFQANSTDQYLFTTQEPIVKVTRVQVFAGDSGSWPCKGMRIFRVDKLGGLYRCNTASSDCYIDFEGDLIAEAVPGTANVSWKNDKLVSTSTGTDISLVTKDSRDYAEPAYAHHELQDNTKKTFALRIDFADAYGAGLEALGAMSGSANTLRNMGLAETLAVTVYYNDVYGQRREVKVPGVLNAAEFTAGLLSGSAGQPVSGLGQQGEGMVIGIFLPEFASLRRNEGIKLTLGASEAKAELGGLVQQGGGLSAEARELRTNRISLSESDTAGFVTMALYDLTGADESGVRITASVDAGTGAIRYTYSGDPAYYQPVASADGDPLYIGSKNTISLRDYEHGKLLAPRDKTERYLIELTTDDAPGAGTKDDIILSIGYTDLEGNVKNSGDLNVRELSRDFNGFWASSAASDPGYYKGVARGQTLRFFVPLTNVKSISDIRVWMKGGGNNDDWQMKDLSVSTVSFYDKRAVSWQAYAVDGVTGKVSFDRTVESTLVYRFTDTAVNPVLVQEDTVEKTDVGPSRTENTSGGGSGSADVAGARKVDWSQLRYSMSFQQASQDLGFGRERYLYAVTVNVGKDEDALASEGDCGSKNLFYFRLIFKNGSSGFVLANQQLASDSFISGASQTFYIATNEDYGDVTAVQIIPEDLASNSDLFDKLNIASIEVKRESNSSLVPVWTISKVGWISIDYRDEGQMQSITGQQGRGAEELTRTYAVDGSTFDMNFMLAIQTEGYPDGAPQFKGNLAAVVYYDSYTPSKGYEEISDVTKSMYSYMNRTSVSSPDVLGGRTTSDTSLMFLPDHTDRFFFSLSDVHSIKRIELQAFSEVNTIWKIKNVALFVVNGTGSLILNKDGEYERIYAEGEELKELATGTSQNAPAYQQILQIYDGSLNENGEPRNALPATINISFTENSIERNPDAAQWLSVMSREPVSENDTLNVFLYPENNAQIDRTYPPVTSIQYTTALDQTAQVSTGDMSRTLYDGRTVFYAVGLNAKRFGVLNSVLISSGRGSGIGGDVRAVIQQVRSGVVIQTWELTGSGYTDIGGIQMDSASLKTTRQQTIQLQLGTDIAKTFLSPPSDELKSTGDNIAVALWYRGDDPTGMELRSPYVYLTDQGYTELRPGQVIGLTFAQKNIAQITGISVVGTGDISGTIEAVRIADQEIGIETGTEAGTIGVYGFTDKLAVTQVPSRLNNAELHDVKKLSMALTTAVSAAEDVSAGHNGPVRMTLGYYDRYGDLIQKTYEDIRSYSTGGENGFLAGSTVNVEMLVPDVTELRWIELEPYGGTVNDLTGSASEGVLNIAGSKKSMWTLEKLSVALGEDEFTKLSELKQQIVEGTPLRLNLADILITANVYVGDNTEPKTIEDGKLIVESGQSIRIVPQVTGSLDGWTAALMKLNPTTGATGEANLADTRGYTRESIAAKAAAASDSRERAIWEAAAPQPGAFDVGAGEVRFTPPRNYTGESIHYRLRVRSLENPASAYVIDVEVEKENDPVAQALDELARSVSLTPETEPGFGGGSSSGEGAGTDAGNSPETGSGSESETGV